MENSTKNNLILTVRFTIFVLCMILIYFLILPVFENKSPESISKEYRDFKKNTFNVMFLGSSVVMNGVYPLQLYDEYGIASYNLGCGSQLLPSSYYLAKQVIRQQKPDLIVLDVFQVPQAAMMADDGITHFVSDFLVFPEKWQFVREVIPKEKQADFVYELGTYHTRWSEINRLDFEKSPETRKGTYGAKVIYNAQDAEGFGNITLEKMPLPENSEKYLRMTIELCKENNVDILLMLMPLAYSANNDGNDRNEWQKYWNQVQDIADEYEVQYLNFMYNYDALAINMSQDMEGGTHLNAYGAEKFTRYLGQYIKDNYKIPDVRENPKYDFMRVDFEDFLVYKNKLEQLEKEKTAD